MEWTINKPDFACVFVSKNSHGDFDLWQFAWELAESEDDEMNYYLSWQDDDGEEWDDISECSYEEYLVLKLLPTMEEVHKQIIEDRTKRGDL